MDNSELIDASALSAAVGAQNTGNPSVKLSTVGGRAFPVAGPTIWNSLPDSVISVPSLSTSRQRLKTFLFQASFPDIIIDPR